ncbi:hypothetical protein Xcc3_03150 [Xanthomonas campestris pv. campestris]|nr:hypothetical protein Xcc3_03150 [Xanthomonas campestris pv. campestris]
MNSEAINNATHNDNEPTALQVWRLALGAARTAAEAVDAEDMQDPLKTGTGERHCALAPHIDGAGAPSCGMRTRCAVRHCSEEVTVGA